MEIEAALENRHVPGVGPICDEDLMVLQKGPDRVPQEGCIVPGQGCDDEDCRRSGRASCPAQIQGVAHEVGQLDPGAGPGLHPPNPDVHSRDSDAFDPPIGPPVAARQIGEQVGGSEETPSDRGLTGGIQRRTPVLARHPGGRPEGGGDIESGFVEGIKHGRSMMLQRNISRRSASDVQPGRLQPRFMASRTWPARASGAIPYGKTRAN